MNNDIERIDRVLNAILAKHGQQLCPSCRGAGGRDEPYYEGRTTLIRCEECSFDSFGFPGVGIVDLKP